MCDGAMHGSDACTCDTTTHSGDEASHGHAGHNHSHHEPPHVHADNEHGHAEAAVTAEYGVAGMTCSHCVASVSEELSLLDGVTNVDIGLVAGGVSRVTVESDRALDEGEVAAAIDEAGYDLVGPPR